MCVESEIRGDVTIGENLHLTSLKLHFKIKHNYFIFFNKMRPFFLMFTGARTVVHPKARIIAEAGPIIIEEGNLIEEQALIINRYCVYYNFISLFEHHIFTLSDVQYVFSPL